MMNDIAETSPAAEVKAGVIAYLQVNDAVKAAAFYQHALGAKLLADTYFGESK